MWSKKTRSGCWRALGIGAAKDGRDSKWVNKSGSAPEALASGERTRLACWQGRPAHANFQSSAAKER